MPTFLSDENFDRRIVQGLLRRYPALDVVTVNAVGLRNTDDRTILAWAAQHGRVLLTHDVHTIPLFVRERIQHGEFCPGVVIVQASVSLGQAVDDLALLIEAAEINEWQDRLWFIPLTR